MENSIKKDDEFFIDIDKIIKYYNKENPDKRKLTRKALADEIGERAGPKRNLVTGIWYLASTKRLGINPLVSWHFSRQPVNEGRSSATHRSLTTHLHR